MHTGFPLPKPGGQKAHPSCCATFCSLARSASCTMRSQVTDESCESGDCVRPTLSNHVPVHTACHLPLEPLRGTCLRRVAQDAPSRGEGQAPIHRVLDVDREPATR